MSKKDKEEIAEAKGNATAVATRESTAVSTEVAVQGVQLEFPFIRLGQGMSQWKANGKKPELGCFYIGKSKELNVKIADMGKDAGITGIILQKVEGFKEDRKWQAGMGAPKRWVIAGLKEDGTPVTEQDCLEAAAKEGYSLTPKDTGEVWPDTGRPKLRANLSRFCYLCLLVPMPDVLESDDFKLYPIGDHLYTTARIEFEKQGYKLMSGIVENIGSRASFAHSKAVKADLAAGKIDAETAKEKLASYKFDIQGTVCHVYSTEMSNRDGIEYIAMQFEKALRDGKPFEFSADEKDDFVRFLMSVKAGSASVDDATSSEFE